MRHSVDQRLYYISGPTVYQAMRPAAAASNWWEIAGETCVAAYQAKGAASQAASYVNLANPGTYDATEGAVAPTWASGTGWTFNGSTNQYLTTAIYPTGGMSMFVRYSGATFVSTRALFGQYSGGGTGSLVQFYASGGNKFRIYNGGNLISTSLAPSGGVVGFAGQYAYLDGTAESGTMSAWIGTATYPILIGAYTNASAMTGNIQAFAVYSTVLDATQVSDLTTAMNAL